MKINQNKFVFLYCFILLLFHNKNILLLYNSLTIYYILSYFFTYNLSVNYKNGELSLKTSLQEFKTNYLFSLIIIYSYPQILTINYFKKQDFLNIFPLF